MLDLLRYATLATKASLLAVCAAGALAGLLALGLRLARRGPARFWLAPAFLALACVPLAAGAGLSAAGVRRLAEDVALLGAHSPMAVGAGLAEAFLPLAAGLFATFGVASLGKPVRVGTDVEAPRKLVHVAPRYPPEALQARLQGKVILECVIGTDGRVEKVEVKRGASLLDDAAREAVRQWVYGPTRLSGIAVPVIMTVTVDFSLR